jgi:hypothetical protein
VRTFSVAERRARLARRHFLSPHRSRTPLDAITAALVGWHATDPATPYLSLWARSPGFTIADLDHELYQTRALAKHLAMRRTLWVVRAVDLPIIQPAASDRVADNERRRLVSDVQKAGVAADGDLWLNRACADVLDHLTVNGPATSSELRQSLPSLAGMFDPAPGKRWGGAVPLAPRVLTVLSVRGDIMRGPNDAAWTSSRPRWAATGHWLAGNPEPVPADQASAELVGGWLRAFGPATVADIKWWFGNTATWARRALTAVAAVEVDLHGAPGFVLPDDLDIEPEPEPWCALLPGLDVTTMGWSERDWYLGAHRQRVFDANGNAGPTAWCNGRVVGGWCQDAAARVHVQFTEDVGRDARQGLTVRAEELTAWLDGVRINPRFPSPLSKAGPTASAPAR